jgi:Uma2 family endonuclease
MALAQNKIYTVDDIYALPDGVRAELINGQIYYMASPNRRHQSITGQLYRKISDYIDQNHGDCRTYFGPFAVFLNKDKRNYVEPDVSVICDPSKLNDKGCVGAPDWIIEVVSPGSVRMDYAIKLFKYRDAGVREYWIVDPDKDRVTVYNFDPSDEENENIGEYSFAEDVPSGIYPDFTINLSKLNL